MCKYMQANGTLLAMPGTHQGKSGWYEYESPDGEEKVVVVKYKVTEEGEWVLQEGPLTRTQYYGKLAYCYRIF